MPESAVHRPSAVSSQAVPGVPMPTLSWQDRLQPIIDKNPLPADQKLEDVIKFVYQKLYTLISAETGAGKTSRVVEALYAAGYMPIISQPRVFATVGVTSRVAGEFKSKIGDLVGYRTGDYKVYGEDTLIQYMTAGYLSRYLNGKQEGGGLAVLEDLALTAGRSPVIVIDEIHEGDADTAFLLALLKRENLKRISKGIEPIKIVAMSATLDIERLERFFETAQTVNIPGRTFPITWKEATQTLEAEIIEQVKTGQNILVFCSGKPEISELQAQLSDREDCNAEILPLHGELSLIEQEKVFAKYPRPKVVLSTNIGQTSITIPDIQVVLIGGIQRVMLIDENGIRYLEAEPTPQSGIEQQGGRGGRVQAGTAIGPFWCPEADRLPYSRSSIECAPPWDQVLQVLSSGIKLDELDFLHSTGAEIKARTFPLLKIFGLIDEAGLITEKGQEVASMPLSFRGACMIRYALEHGELLPTIDSVAVFEVGGIIDYENTEWQNLIGDETDSDILAQAKILRYAVSVLDSDPEPRRPDQVSSFDLQKVSDFCKENSLKQANLVRALEARRRMRRHLKIDSADQAPLVSKKTALKAIAAGIFDFAYSRDSNGHLEGLELVDERFLAKDSVLNDNKAETVVGHPINVTVIEDDGPGAVMRILPLASKYDPRWKAEVAPHLFGPNSGLIAYSPKYDAVMEQSPLIPGAVSRERDFIEVTDKAVAAEVFAKWFAGLMCGDDMHRLIARDQAIVRLIRDNRMLITTFKPTREEVERFFYKALNGASSLKELPSLKDLVFTK